MVAPRGNSAAGHLVENIIQDMNEEMEKWLAGHPNATLREAFEGGWYGCTDAWCHGKREKMEQVTELIKEILE